MLSKAGCDLKRHDVQVSLNTSCGSNAFKKK